MPEARPHSDPVRTQRSLTDHLTFTSHKGLGAQVAACAPASRSGFCLNSRKQNLEQPLVWRWRNGWATRGSPQPAAPPPGSHTGRSERRKAGLWSRALRSPLPRPAEPASTVPALHSVDCAFSAFWGVRGSLNVITILTLLPRKIY